MADTSELMSIEDLTEIYRVEHKSGALSNVRKDFYPAVANFMKDLKSNCERIIIENPDSPAFDSYRNLQRRAQKYSKEIVDFRMGKICKMAVRGAMGGSVSMDQLTPEERVYYDTVFEASRLHRELLEKPDSEFRSTPLPVTPALPTGPIDNLFGSRKTPAPAFEEEPMEDDAGPAEDYPEAYGEGQPSEMDDAPSAPATVTENVETDTYAAPLADDDGFPPEEDMEIPDDELDRMIPPDVPLSKPIEKKAVEAPVDNGMAVIRVLEDIPTFAGYERNYELKKEQIARIPKLFAEALRDVGKVQILDATP